MSYLKGLAHIGIFTKDIDVAKAFYVDKLGCELYYEKFMEEPNDNWSKFSFLKLGSLNIELIQSTDLPSERYKQLGIIDHFAIEVENIEEAVNELKVKGVVFNNKEPIYLGDFFDGIKIIYFTGPDDLRIELFQYL